MPVIGSSWGRYPPVADQRILPISDRRKSLPTFETTALPYGNGRSYGDSCLNPRGALLHTRGMDHYLRFDPTTGQLECEAGVLLADILRLILSKGWFLPVTPGTRFVTVGGAIANDVHGKNHHAAGSFGDHVIDLELLRSDGSRRLCSPSHNPAWFRATVGGLGLTGLIVKATLQLRRVSGAAMDICTQRFGRLSDFFRLSEDALGNEYRVAWIDCLAKGDALGRGVFISGNHSAASHAEKAQRRLSMPLTPPLSLVNGVSLRSFNTLYFNRAPTRPRQHTVDYQPFFYPLDRIADWNRMYGPAGFLQYQCVVPPSVAEAATTELLGRIAAAGQGSFLVVLKQFGSRPTPGMLSFPRAGTTLAMDFPYHGRRTLDLLEQLDEVVLTAGGALYPAKDARMSAAMFAASFPQLAEFQNYRDPRFSSGFWRRVMDTQ